MNEAAQEDTKFLRIVAIIEVSEGIPNSEIGEALSDAFMTPVSTIHTAEIGPYAGPWN